MYIDLCFCSNYDIVYWVLHLQKSGVERVPIGLKKIHFPDIIRSRFKKTLRSLKFITYYNHKAYGLPLTLAQLYRPPPLLCITRKLGTYILFFQGKVIVLEFVGQFKVSTLLINENYASDEFEFNTSPL